MTTSEPSSKPSKVLTREEYNVLLELFDTNHNNHLSEVEIREMIKVLKHKPLSEIDPRLVPILKKFDENGDGKLDETELLTFVEHALDGNIRFAGYSGALARAFRYLAFTSDLGEALRPVAKQAVVTASYAVAFGYCVADVAYEAHKLKERGYVTEKNVPMTMTQCIVERSAFQAIASLIVPAVLIHTTVDVGKKIFAKIGRYTKFGPSILGLSVIPLLPLYLDHPVEHGVEAFFKNYGPWASVPSIEGTEDKKHR
jgi:fission process protein 1